MLQLKTWVAKPNSLTSYFCFYGKKSAFFQDSHPDWWTEVHCPDPYQDQGTATEQQCKNTDCVGYGQENAQLMSY